MACRLRVAGRKGITRWSFLARVPAAGKVDSAPVMPTAERSVGLGHYSDKGGLRAAGVIPGSPAEEANLGPGALVNQIEHRPVANWTHDPIEQWINSSSTRLRGWFREIPTRLLRRRS
jgi:hypothetical protein